jgi:ubiquitin
MPTKVFFSHAWAKDGKENDKIIHQRVMKIKKHIESSATIEIWIDEEKLGVGDDIAKKITHGIEKCEYFIVFLTKEYEDKLEKNDNWVSHEFNECFRLGRKPIIIRMEQEVGNSRRLEKLMKDNMYGDFSEIEWDGEVPQDAFILKCNKISRTLLKPKVSCCDCDVSVASLGQYYDRCCGKFLCFAHKEKKDKCDIITLQEHVRELRTRKFPSLRSATANALARSKAISIKHKQKIAKANKLINSYRKVIVRYF